MFYTEWCILIPFCTEYSYNIAVLISSRLCTKLRTTALWNVRASHACQEAHLMSFCVARPDMGRYIPTQGQWQGAKGLLYSQKPTVDIVWRVGSLAIPSGQSPWELSRSKNDLTPDRGYRRHGRGKRKLDGSGRFLRQAHINVEARKVRLCRGYEWAKMKVHELEKKL